MAGDVAYNTAFLTDAQLEHWNSMTAAEIRARFDAAFGAGAGERVQVHCRGDGGRTLIQELRIRLSGVITPEAPVDELIRAAEPLSPGCPAGVVDPAGLQ